MMIQKHIYWKLLNSVPTAPPEAGGILGSVNGIVCAYQMDIGYFAGRGCFYSPNTSFLNSHIKKWQEQGIQFCGIFHTHFFGVQTLSDGDALYIRAIMQAMPRCIHQLYFPIVVLPEKEIVSYFAIHNGEMVEIRNDVLRIV